MKLSHFLLSGFIWFFLTAYTASCSGSDNIEADDNSTTGQVQTGDNDINASAPGLSDSTLVPGNFNTEKTGSVQLKSDGTVDIQIPGKFSLIQPKGSLQEGTLLSQKTISRSDANPPSDSPFYSDEAMLYTNDPVSENIRGIQAVIKFIKKMGLEGLKVADGPQLIQIKPPGQIDAGAAMETSRMIGRKPERWIAEPSYENNNISYRIWSDGPTPGLAEALELSDGSEKVSVRAQMRVVYTTPPEFDQRGTMKDYGIFKINARIYVKDVANNEEYDFLYTVSCGKIENKTIIYIVEGEKNDYLWMNVQMDLQQDTGQLSFGTKSGSAELPAAANETSDTSPEINHRQTISLRADPISESDDFEAISGSMNWDAGYVYAYKKFSDGNIREYAMDRASQKYIVWSYGLYHASTGQPLEIDSGFPVVSDDGLDGWASPWGVELWDPANDFDLPDPAGSGSVVTRVNFEGEPMARLEVREIPGYLYRAARKYFPIAALTDQDIFIYEENNLLFKVIWDADSGNWLRIARSVTDENGIIESKLNLLTGIMEDQYEPLDETEDNRVFFTYYDINDLIHQVLYDVGNDQFVIARTDCTEDASGEIISCGTEGTGDAVPMDYSQDLVLDFYREGTDKENGMAILWQPGKDHDNGQIDGVDNLIVYQEEELDSLTNIQGTSPGKDLVLYDYTTKEAACYGAMDPYWEGEATAEEALAALNQIVPDTYVFKDSDMTLYQGEIAQIPANIAYNTNKLYEDEVSLYNLRSAKIMFQNQDLENDPCLRIWLPDEDQDVFSWWAGSNPWDKKYQLVYLDGPKAGTTHIFNKPVSFIHQGAEITYWGFGYLEIPFGLSNTAQADFDQNFFGFDIEGENAEADFVTQMDEFLEIHWDAIEPVVTLATGTRLNATVNGQDTSLVVKVLEADEIMTQIGIDNPGLNALKASSALEEVAAIAVDPQIGKKPELDSKLPCIIDGLVNDTDEEGSNILSETCPKRDASEDPIKKTGSN